MLCIWITDALILRPCDGRPNEELPGLQVPAAHQCRPEPVESSHIGRIVFSSSEEAILVLLQQWVVCRRLARLC